MATTIDTMAEDWHRHGPGALIPWTLYAIGYGFMAFVLIGTALALLLVLTGTY